MRIIRRTFANLSKSTLFLGKVGENLVTRLEIDVSKEINEFQNPVFELVLKTPALNDTYPVLVEFADNNMLYTFTGSDLAESGYGELEALVCGTNGEVLKSTTAKTKIDPSTIPSSYPGPLQKIIDDIKKSIEDGAFGSGIEVVNELSETSEPGTIVYLQYNGSIDSSLNGLYLRTKSNENPWRRMTSDKSVLIDYEILAKINEQDGKIIFDNDELITKDELDNAVSELENQIAAIGVSDDTLVPLELGTEYASLLLRQDWSDVPVYVTDTVSGYTTDGIPSTNVFSMGLFADHTDADADFIRVVENADYVTGRPMLLLRVQRNGTGYTCFPEAFHGIMEDYVAGWYDDEDNAVSAPSLDGMTFGALEVNLEWYDDLSDLPLKAQLALDALSRMVNVSEAARGSLGVRPDMAQRYVGRLDGNRRYRRIASKDFALTFPTLTETETPCTIRLDLTCTRDVTLTMPRERLMDGGVLPNTRRGFHTLTFTYFPAAGKWSVGSVDRIVPQYWDDIPDEVTPFGDCTWAQIKSIAAHGYKNNLGQWCIRRNNAEEVWFEIGDEKTITLSTGETWTLQIWDFNHDDLADGSGKAPFTIGMKGVTNTTYKMNTSNTKAGGWEVCYFRVHVLPTILETLPSDLQSTIAEVTKLSTPNDLSTIINTTDKLFLLSVSEITSLSSATDNINEGTRYTVFYSGYDYGSTSSWLRTSYGSYYPSRWRLSQGTSATNRMAADSNSNQAVRLAFCI